MAVKSFPAHRNSGVPTKAVVDKWVHTQKTRGKFLILMGKPVLDWNVTRFLRNFRHAGEQLDELFHRRCDDMLRSRFDLEAYEPAGVVGWRGEGKSARAGGSNRTERICGKPGWFKVGGFQQGVATLRNGVEVEMQRYRW